MNELAERPPGRSTRAQGLLGSLPTFIVLGCIGAVGYWGHRTGWKAPRFSQLFGSESREEREDWCLDHSVPESRCIACHPELAGESSEGWCKEHGVPESRCTVCHPEILRTGVAGDWCEEHGLPESSCTACHPEIARRAELPAEVTEVVVSSGSHEHEREEDHPGGPPGDSSSAAIRDPRTCQKHALKVQFASPAALEKCGIVLGQVVERPMSDSIVVNAELDYDRARFAKLAPRVPGTVRYVARDLGEAVVAGDVLALIDSADVGRAKSELLQAQAAVTATSRAAKRVRASSDAGFRTETEHLEADARAREAEIRLFDARQAIENLGLALPSGDVDQASLATLGLQDARLAAVTAGGSSANLVPLSAPFAGLVVGRQIVVGEVVDTGRVVFEVADTSRMWVSMDVPQSDAHRLAIHQEVIFRPDDARDEVVVGLITWISTAVDEMTRTVKVRAEVENRDGGLRAHSFGRAQIVLRTSPKAVAVPTQAVQWEGCCYVVFVKLADDIFQTRKVRLGAKDAAYTEIVAGLVPGEIVATEGSHVLKSEILKSHLGAGCTDE